MAAPGPLLSTPMLAGTAAEAVDARTVKILLRAEPKKEEEERRRREEKEKELKAEEEEVEDPIGFTPHLALFFFPSCRHAQMLGIMAA